MRTTIADVAAHAGVSKTTVSRVLNAKSDVEASTAARVRQVIDDLGYVPSTGAVGLARGRTGVVGVLVPSITWPWMGEVLQGAIDALESELFGVMLFTCNRGDDSIRRFASQVSARSFDGVVVIEPEGTIDFIAGLYKSGLPVVKVDDRASQPLFPSVGTTNYAGAQSAALHLLERGRRRPLVVRGYELFGCTVERLDGFAQAFAAAGYPIDEARVLDGDFTVEGGRAAIRQALADDLSFDAVFAHNDLSAAGALAQVRSAGLQIPADVAVVGFDDVPLAALTEPPLTSVHQPLREMGAAAAHMLLHHVRGQQLDNIREIIPTSLTIRGSS